MTSYDLNAPRRLVEKALGEGMFPGAVILVDVHGEPVLHEAFGRTGDEKSPAVTVETLFDLASLTKVLCTTLLWMVRESRDPGRIDRPLGRWFPEVPPDKAHITPRLLLAHASGLPTWMPYYLFAGPNLDMRRFLLGKILSEPLVYKSTEASIYSDLGFVLLGFAVERETGLRMDHAAVQELFVPLGVQNELMFGPATSARATALTRPGDPGGLVHDLNSRALGGVAGHAGLFGTARGVARVASAIMAGARGRAGFFDSATAAMFCRRAGLVSGSTRALGFDTPSSTDSASGRHLSPASVGHTGFTGTSLWMDLEREVTVVLLTNRVYAGEADMRIKAFRPAFHDTVMERLGLA